MELFHFLGMFTLEIFMENIQGITLVILIGATFETKCPISCGFTTFEAYQDVLGYVQQLPDQRPLAISIPSAHQCLLLSTQLVEASVDYHDCKTLCFKAEEMRSIEQIMYCVLTPYANFRYLVQRICIYQELSQILKCDQQHQ